MTQYTDSEGNIYRPERASNGAWVVARINSGGNRKGFKPVGVRTTEEKMQKALDVYAEVAKWRPA